MTTLPHLSDRLFITDGGMETTLVFHQGIDLPDFASFDLLRRPGGRQIIEDYFRTYLALAVKNQVGFILESPTWRANPDWGTRLGYSSETLAAANREAIALLQTLRQQYESATTPIVISGCFGPRGDGYSSAIAMTEAEAEHYHRPQMETFQQAGVDMVAALTMTYVQEAIGITRAAQAVGLPVVISFTVETDSRLPSGTTLKDAIAEVDAATDNGPAYYMINCAHPTHFANAFAVDQAWMQRIRGLRANASAKSHAELDESTELDAGNPAELGQQYRELRAQFPHITILGGCCGTDDRHIEAICQACLPLAWAHLSQPALIL
ncbi:homocysteine S-methyltransferase family protein [Leptolyngbya sp. CCNP1308]|uniref:homocysteine S-methyltransferase family protein n=1 Tax=Leptolyngbya sp. CCNP1308 TaxID=3110255 RepID=UPI002B21EBF9|nr:homocysteine S-methyltransferase family protein [Leptolyngbya sp. CCNP1308]MEA5449581.1 homocysteine S-methyltransferase family protein [Leptolyngbya sp. CCNP1308]